MLSTLSRNFARRSVSVARSRFFHATQFAQEKLSVEGLAEKVDLNGQNVLMRVDLNVPLDKADDVTVTDDTRLRAVVPTTKFLLEKGANVILCSHFGRPKGEIIETGKNGRLNPVVKPLEGLLGVPVKKVNDCMGPDVEAAASSLDKGEVLLLENTRFYKGETKNDPELSAGLGKLADYFVMDAFGTAHRAHSSTAGVAEHMKMSAAGFLLGKELKYLKGAVDDPTPPMMAIIGGAKVSTKLPVIESLLEKCDTILLGGGMIFTFYKAMGYGIGKSLVEEDMVGLAGDLMKKAEEKGVKLMLPTDVVLADAFDNDANTALAKVTDIDGDWMGLDIGPESLDAFTAAIAEANTIVFNGPMGVFEMPNFAVGTLEVSKALAKATEERGATTIVGGGDSVAAVNQAGLGDKVSHISTGGGASLELLEGKELPGVAALTEV
uniref:Phosphoglycerate kinase n=1 Tax=Grammatophora oceanica TaxID=210454 RepID=A0A7S1V1F8_9STRA|mmetsp:Transcript_3401/g.4640  ORF Transcript_3401/g.4640 Transcript_3401/m.4640 type:complete len:437 (+) Transcript_3401:82-1392(+)|eukprot:CAMPEP_0194038226 /NCGR_PEP_ID=MMETSP0009_2-20130614/10481_1 /TAXON_ID=210454 /ORGANISM="Grammatophora oceanica, Strain CCMP 410" /LENGTH=436 /DNA_ID=CAMNT_0038680659 /DNA_START=77 /DNA_END=1387 /DNA_ORIENTATION=-